jgi:hypothetical protein
MEDLYLIFREKLAAGVTAIHPYRWLVREAYGPLSIGRSAVLTTQKKSRRRRRGHDRQ